MTVYHELFQQQLEELIAAGGEASRIIGLVSIHQEQNPAAREWAFREWARSMSLPCEHCRKVFTPAAEQISEDDQVLCQWCATAFLGRHREPVPGWTRTWRR